MTVTLPAKPAVLVEEYLKLRNQRQKDDARWASFRKETYDLPMEALEAQLLDILNRTGADSIKSKSGTVAKKLSTSVTTADGAEFREYVIANEMWELADWKPNKTAVNELVERGEPIPPGINRSTAYTIRVLKGSE